MRIVSTIRKKIVITALAPVLILAMTALFTVFTITSAVQGVQGLFIKNYYMQELLTEVNYIQTALSSYMATKNSEDLRKVIHYSRSITDKAVQLDKEVSADQESLLERNIASLIGEFISASNNAVQSKRGRNLSEYTQRLQRVEELASLIQERTNLLMLDRMKIQLSAFSVFSKNVTLIRSLSLSMILVALFFSISIIFYFTDKISAPIIHLGNAANQIASGIYDEQELMVEADDEIGATARAFNLMKKSIIQSFNEIKNKAEIERALMEQQMKNLEMTSLLKNAELSALQARINPHFLFNTLNTGIQLAVVEDADRTRRYLEQLTKLMRYSFRDLDIPVALAEEMDSMRSYLYLMSIRFPDVFDFSMQIISPAEHAIIPKMTIQPLVENAIRHGLKDMTSSASLTIQAYVDEYQRLYINIEDNGNGISPNRITEIFNAADHGTTLDKNGEGGMGMVNVIQRLRLFSGEWDVIQIEPITPRGTRIIISLPYREHT
ncbi:sensor histidine kinase [Gracilinema caldarium]|uniref:histidine kinase n=1 Tax=Gracilinema caldarium (strain ATCC 51460 / DSM 7334 / H1) TaxID=744872 RepID=F8F3Q4_GRAC1|nr:histidine kinase [Gracilinema caldarium]AEJ19998.1 signal transduction histidine kinase, LytS [Gracilinema caldarium DSM 7334]